MINRARRIYQSEGLAALLKQGWSFLASRFFRYQAYYLSTRSLSETARLSESNYRPKIDNLEFHIVTSNTEADELDRQGLEFRSKILGSRKRLARGAIALCIFVNGELANIGWLALSKEAQESLDEPQIRVDYSKGAVWTGGLWTDPKYRHLGLGRYHVFKKHQFMLDKGLVTEYNVIARKNLAHRRLADGLSNSIHAKGRYLKILWWKSWKVQQLTP